MPPWGILPPPRAPPRPWSRADHGLRPETFKAATRAFLLVARRYGLDASSDVVEAIVAMAAPPPVCPVLDRWRSRELGGLSPLLPPAEAKAAAAPESESEEEDPRVSYWVTAARPPPVDDVEMRAKVSEFAGRLRVPPSCVSGYRWDDNSIVIESLSRTVFRF